MLTVKTALLAAAFADAASAFAASDRARIWDKVAWASLRTEEPGAAVSIVLTASCAMATSDVTLAADAVANSAAARAPAESPSADN